VRGLSHERHCARELLRAPEPCDALQSSDVWLLCEEPLNEPVQAHALEFHDERSSLHAKELSAILGRAREWPHATLLCHALLRVKGSLHGTLLTPHANLGL
jgi:hypothetical protein